MRRLLLLLLLLAIGTVAPTVAQAATCLDGTTMPLDEVATATDPATVPDGFEAHGLTVSRGKDPEQFDVTVLGVLDDGVAVGHDMIIVDVHDYPAMDDPHNGSHGIWAGMSGSPVYTNEATPRLIGSISFGLSLGPSTIGGVTPAAELDAVLGRPAAAAFARGGVRAPAALQKRMVATGAVSAREAASRFEQLPIPLAVSGLAQGRLQAFADRLPGHQHFIPFRAGLTGPAGAVGDPDEIQPGSNFAAAISYGDVTAAGVGTTTARCDDSVVAFGHPFNFDGPTSLSVHNATAIKIQNDPAFVPFKIANIGGLVGTLDQDRTSGIRALLGDAPTPVVVTSRITDNGGAAQQGETDVNRTSDAPNVAAFHLLGDVDSVIDRIGAGSMNLSWTVTGTAAGKPFTFTRSNMFADQGDISFSSPDELFGMLQTIVDNPFTAVKFQSVDMTANVMSQFKQFEVTGLQRFEGGKWVPVGERDTITLTPGQSLRVRVLLQNFRNSAPVAPVEFSFPVPADASGDGSLDITGAVGGGDDSGGDVSVSDDGSTEQPKSLGDLFKLLKDTPKNNDLTGALTLFGSGGGGEGDGPPAFFADATPAPITKSLAEVVTGALSIPVTIPSDEPPESEPPTVVVGGKSKGKLGTTLRKGLRLTVTSSAPGRLLARALVDKKTARKFHLKKKAKGPVVVASRAKNVGDGRTRVTLKFTKKAKKRLKHAKRVKLTVRAALTDSDGNTGVDSAKVVLTRKTH
jgi:hypothetical protein